MTQVINKTPHDLHFYDNNNNCYLTIEGSESPARVQVQTKPVTSAWQDCREGIEGYHEYQVTIPVQGLNTNSDGIPITENSYGEVENLPSLQKDTIYVVSMMVANACPDRNDLYIVNETVRDERGRIIGAKSLAKNPNCQF